MKILTILCFILGAKIAEAKYFTVVSISGFLESRKKAEPGHKYSGVHHEYDQMLDKWIYARHRFNHGVSKRRIKETINQLDCSADHGLIIVTNSWGSRKALIFNELYAQKCHKPTELFIMIDGIKKPIGSQNIRPNSKKCINYYQQKSFLIQGAPIKGCDNRDMTPSCTRKNKSSFESCHMYTCRIGAKASQQDIENWIIKEYSR